MPIDPHRRAAIQQALAQAGLDALFVRLGENLLPLTGYWPGLWLSAALIKPDGEPILFCPEMEAERAAQGWATDVRTFRCWRLGDPDPEASLIQLLRDAAGKLAGRRVGYEGGFDLVGPAFAALEQPAAARVQIERVLSQALGEVELVDATAALYAIRAVKTPAELVQLRVAAEIAAFGLAAFVEYAEAGRTEVEVAAAVERAVMVQGTGYRGTRVARACAQVTSGSDTDAFWGYPISRPRPLSAGEVVVLEMGVVADGFWADVARVRVAGSGAADERVAGMAAAVCAAQDAALAAIHPGVPAAAVDRASYDTLLAHNFGPYLQHSLGHGLGFRYHEPLPLLDPASTDVLVEGMVLAMEPGVYLPGVAGVRYENNAIVTANGAELLTTFGRSLA